MTATQADSYLDHPMFRKAMRSMQKGDWDSGLDEIEKLMQAYPLEPELRSLRQEMMIRSSVDAEEKKDVSQARKKRFRDLVIRFSVVAVLVILAVVVLRSYSTEIRKQARIVQQNIEYQAVQTDLFFMMRDAQDYLNAGLPDSAIAELEKIAEVDPEYPELQAALERAHTLKALDVQYTEALNLIEQNDLTAALVILEEIETTEPYYRDVRSRILEIQDETILGDQLQQADEFFENDQYEEAADAYYNLYSLNPDYQTSHIEERLFDSYVNAADILLNTSDTLEGTQKVEEYYRKALALRPQDPDVSQKQARIRASIEEKLFRSYVFLAEQALVEESDSLEALALADKYYLEALKIKPNDPDISLQRELAANFVSGQDNLLNSAYGDAINDMEFVLSQAPGYAGGIARQTLYEAYVGRGDDAKAIGDFDSALEDYQRAATIANDDPTQKARVYEVQLRIAETQGLLGNYEQAVGLYQEAILYGDLQARAERFSAQMAQALAQAQEYASQGNYQEAYRSYREAVGFAYQVYDVVEYVVQSGDYLSQIALDHNSTVNLIAEANNLANPNIIITGQKLLIPILP